MAKSERSKKSKVLTSVAAVVLAASMLIGGGTYAYLQGETNDVVNEFNTNQVTVDLTETTGGNYEIIPGTTQDKDPKVTVNATVPAYVFVTVEDTTDGLVDYAIADGWTKLDGYDNVYYREVAASDTAQEFYVLAGNKVSYDAALANSDMVDEEGNLKEGLELTFKAYAIQKQESTYSNGNPKNFNKESAYLMLTSDDEIKITSRTAGSKVLSEGKTAVLASDITGTLSMAASGKTSSVDLNGMSIKKPTSMFGAAIRLYNNNADEMSVLTVNGEGIVNGVNSSAYNMAVHSEGAGAKIIINSGTYTNEGANTANDDQFDLIYAEAGGQIEINGGTFICATPKWTLNLQDNSGSSIVVKGGTFFEFDPSNADTEPGEETTNFVADGYKVVSEVKDDGTWYTVVPE